MSFEKMSQFHICSVLTILPALICIASCVLSCLDLLFTTQCTDAFCRWKPCSKCERPLIRKPEKQSPKYWKSMTIEALPPQLTWNSKPSTNTSQSHPTWGNSQFRSRAKKRITSSWQVGWNGRHGIQWEQPNIELPTHFPSPEYVNAFVGHGIPPAEVAPSFWLLLPPHLLQVFVGPHDFPGATRLSCSMAVPCVFKPNRSCK